MDQHKLQEHRITPQEPRITLTFTPAQVNMVLAGLQKLPLELEVQHGAFSATQQQLQQMQQLQQNAASGEDGNAPKAR